MRGRRGRRILSAVAIFLAAMALQRACTLPWGTGMATDGSRFVLTALGLSQHPAPGAGDVRDCRWWPRYGDADLCAVRTDSRGAAARLRLAYPLMQVGLWLAVASLLLQALRVPRTLVVQTTIPGLVAAGGVAAVAILRGGASRALMALEGVPMRFDAPGHTAALAACVLAAASTLLVATSFRDPSAT